MNTLQCTALVRLYRAFDTILVVLAFSGSRFNSSGVQLQWGSSGLSATGPGFG